MLHYSLQHNHLHLIVESNDKNALGRGIMALAGSLGRRLNRVLGSHGRVWGDRYHAHELRTPTEVRNALVYVLRNHRKHRLGAGAQRCAEEDRFSSASAFDGWGKDDSSDPTEEVREPSPPVSSPRTWLLRMGWRRRGLIRATEGPREDIRGRPRDVVYVWEYLEVV